jgi:hypothetical protein
MNLLPPLTPALKRRSAIALGTAVLTSLAIGGVAANAQAGSEHTSGKTHVAVALSAEPAQAVPAIAAVAGTKSATLPKCSDLVASVGKVRVTKLKTVKAIKSKQLIDAVPGVEAKAKKGAFIKEGSAEATLVRIEGNGVKALVAVPACVATKSRR